MNQTTSNTRTFGVIALCVLAVLGWSLGIGFFLDDLHILERAIQAPLTPEGLAHSFTVFDPQTLQVWCMDQKPIAFFRPLLMLTFKLDHALYGTHAFGYHLTNLILHLLNCWMLFLVLVELKVQHHVARLGACLFAIFPHHTVSVIWIAGRTDLLMATCSMASILFYARSLRPNSSLDRVLSLLFAVAAFLSKESAVALPGYLLAVDWIADKPQSSFSSMLKRALRRIWPFVLLVILYLVYRFGLFGPFETPPKPYYFNPTDDGFALFLLVKTAYYYFCWMTTFPIMPIAPVAYLLKHPAILSGMVLLTAGGIALVIRKLKGLRIFWGLLAWTLACQVPVAMVMASNHYVYIGNAAVASIVALLLRNHYSVGERPTLKNRVILAIIMIVYATYLGFGQRTYNRFSNLNRSMGEAVERLEGGNLPADTQLYLINIPFVSAHLGQRLRVLHGEKLTARLLSVSSAPFGFGPEPAYTWKDDRTLILSLQEDFIASEFVEMLLMMGVDLQPDKTYTSGPATLVPRADARGEIRSLEVTFTQPVDNLPVRIIMFKPIENNKAEVIQLSPTREKRLMMDFTAI